MLGRGLRKNERDMHNSQRDRTMELETILLLESDRCTHTNIV